MTWGEIRAIAVKNVACGYCEASPGSRCRTTSGEVARYPHQRRVDPIQTAWSEGWRDGRNDTLDAFDRTDIRHFTRMLEVRRAERGAS